MRRLIHFILLILFLSNVAHAEEQNIDALVNEKMHKLMSDSDIPGAAVVVYEDGVPHAYYFGYANKDKKKPVNAKTIFEIGSISKVMTTLLLAQEIDYAKMGFNDSLTTYLKTIPEKFKDVQLKHLATHTAGFPFEPKSIADEETLQNFLNNFHGNVPSGKQYQYSNIGIGLLGQALAAETEFDFNKLYLRHIAQPLKMTPIGLVVPAKLNKDYAQGYNEAGEPVPHVQPSALSAAYGIKLAAQDMKPYLAAAIGLPQTPARVLWPMRMSQSIFMQHKNELQGLSWNVHSFLPADVAKLLTVPKIDLSASPVDSFYEHPTYNPNALIDKTGSTAGFKAYVAVIPNKKSGIMIMTNKNVSNNNLVKTAREILFHVNKML